MGDYRKKSNEPKVPANGDIDINELADLIAGKVSKLNPAGSVIMRRGFSEDVGPEDSFDATQSMKDLAKSMVVQRGNKSSNFEDLGGVKETKKDDGQTNSTIDLLTDLED